MVRSLVWITVTTVACLAVVRDVRAANPPGEAEADGYVPPLAPDLGPDEEEVPAPARVPAAGAAEEGVFHVIPALAGAALTGSTALATGTLLGALWVFPCGIFNWPAAAFMVCAMPCTVLPLATAMATMASVLWEYVAGNRRPLVWVRLGATPMAALLAAAPFFLLSVVLTVGGSVAIIAANGMVAEELRNLGVFVVFQWGALAAGAGAVAAALAAAGTYGGLALADERSGGGTATLW